MGPNLQEEINKLHHAYMPMDLNSAYHQNKVIAVKKLDYILKNTDRRNLQESDFQELLLCSLTLVYYFGMRLKLSRLTSRYWYWCGKRQFNKTEAVFQRTMDLLHPERSDVTIRITLKFFTDVKLWSFESFVGQILEIVLYFNRGKTTLFNIMLTDIHCVLFHDVKSARHRMRILYGLLKSRNWVIDKQKLLPFVTRLLDFFACSICKSYEKIPAYGYLRQGFEVCLRRIFERVENGHRLLIITTMLNWFSISSPMSDDDVLEFSTLIDHAAKLYKVESYMESFNGSVFVHVLNILVGSSNALYSLIGCRLLVRFLDRQNNAPFLIVPTIYYEFSQVGLIFVRKIFSPLSIFFIQKMIVFPQVRLKIRECDKKDKHFIRRHRDKFHEFLIQAVNLHCNSATNLKSLFAVICCLVLEVPCGITAAAAACMAMSVQDYALNGENLSATCRYWMHAIVVSIMSLICWVHKAQVLYSYVNQIISRRAKEAPQLNPPLMQLYDIGRRHVTWNKPTLFFEDWELRYGLWKHFQDNQVQVCIFSIVSAG